MDRGAWWATVYGVTKSGTRLSDCARMTAQETLVQLLATPYRLLPPGSWGLLCSIKDTAKDCEHSVFLERLLNQMRRGLSPCPFYR